MGKRENFGIMIGRICRVKKEKKNKEIGIILERKFEREAMVNAWGNRDINEWMEEKESHDGEGWGGKPLMQKSTCENNNSGYTRFASCKGI